MPAAPVTGHYNGAPGADAELGAYVVLAGFVLVGLGFLIGHLIARAKEKKAKAALTAQRDALRQALALEDPDDAEASMPRGLGADVDGCAHTFRLEVTVPGKDFDPMSVDGLRIHAAFQAALDERRGLRQDLMVRSFDHIGSAVLMRFDKKIP